MAQVDATHSQRESLRTGGRAWDRLAHDLPGADSAQTDANWRRAARNQARQRRRRHRRRRRRVKERASVLSQLFDSFRREEFAYESTAKSHSSRDDLRILPPGASRIGLLSTLYERLKNSIHVCPASLIGINERGSRLPFATLARAK